MRRIMAHSTCILIRMPSKLLCVTAPAARGFSLARQSVQHCHELPIAPTKRLIRHRYSCLIIAAVSRKPQTRGSAGVLDHAPRHAEDMLDQDSEFAEFRATLSNVHVPVMTGNICGRWSSCAPLRRAILIYGGRARYEMLSGRADMCLAPGTRGRARMFPFLRRLQYVATEPAGVYETDCTKGPASK